MKLEVRSVADDRRCVTRQAAEEVGLEEGRIEAGSSDASDLMKAKDMAPASNDDVDIDTTPPFSPKRLDTANNAERATWPQIVEEKAQAGACRPPARPSGGCST